MTDPYESLANAVILLAVKDYRSARKKRKYHPKNKDAKLIVEDCERFFRSNWFAALTSVDWELLTKKLQEEEIS